MPDLVIENLTKAFNLLKAIDDVSLTVADGEFVTLLGPSGCGKSTTLGAIAGLDRADIGRIRLGNQVFFDGAESRFMPPEKRDIGLVFQSYALWPHMTVRKNLEYPLKLRKVPAKERDSRIDEVLDLVEMAPYADRYPFALSGGQQQRVALARTLVYRPRLLLLDEPLSNLDAKLRERARIWLRNIQSRVNVTTVYVTHDQIEALALSDRIAVMSKGKIVQLAPPRVVYDNPATEFVADFIGSANIFPGALESYDSKHSKLRLADDGILIADRPPPEGAKGRLSIAVRPERILFIHEHGDVPSENVFTVKVESASFLGARLLVVVRLGDTQLRVECDSAPEGDVVRIVIPPSACTLFEMQA
ncbi:ABC transporter ATP-binding protein [Devosia yakushimensis]|uniref:ABC transporter ATP-binding protein n=1 Tax=Devosia yakushimensis TaxID=470028 RepID=A0ABQ5UJ73_9HYPH|nr:ABC transporter ATP-binding protein [Devosia yakushimensis]GLQ12107.1 ABC transporter ATP-binding protein [Devosia yakushimensis]